MNKDSPTRKRILRVLFIYTLGIATGSLAWTLITHRMIRAANLESERKRAEIRRMADEIEERQRLQRLERIEVQPIHRKTNVEKLISFTSTEELEGRRGRLREIALGPDGAAVELEVTAGDEILHRHPQLKRLPVELSVERLILTMNYDVQSKIYHLVPEEAGNHLLIYHTGHDGFLNPKTCRVLAFLLDRRFPVALMGMPLQPGNNQPVVECDRFGKMKLDDHEKLFLLDERPLRFFLQPVFALLDHLDGRYESISMIGLSGGGWTTNLAAAMDTRIVASYNVGGSIPFYLQVRNYDWVAGSEGGRPVEFYRAANYLELYVLDSTGSDPSGCPRCHRQIINLQDPVCCGGPRFETYASVVEAKAAAFGGDFRAVAFPEKQHRVSPDALRFIVRDIQEVVDARPAAQAGR